MVHTWRAGVSKVDIEQDKISPRRLPETNRKGKAGNVAENDDTKLSILEK